MPGCGALNIVPYRGPQYARLGAYCNGTAFASVETFCFIHSFIQEKAITRVLSAEKTATQQPASTTRKPSIPTSVLTMKRSPLPVLHTSRKLVLLPPLHGPSRLPTSRRLHLHRPTRAGESCSTRTRKGRCPDGAATRSGPSHFRSL